MNSLVEISKRYQNMRSTKANSAISCITLSLFGLALSTTIADAEGLPKSLQCNFSSGKATTFEAGSFSSTDPKPLSFQISAIDLEKQSAALVTKGQKAPGQLKIVRAIDANHFIEIVNEGYLNLTTIYDIDPKTKKYPAVHSRHLGILGQPIFAQYTGFCSPKS